MIFFYILNYIVEHPFSVGVIGLYIYTPPPPQESHNDKDNNQNEYTPL